jgi:predicted GNAT superfamily acetyltransferase
MSASEITVRTVGDVAGSRMIQEVERRTWGAEETDILPTHILVTLAKNGGLVLGAFALDGPAATGGMVGFVVGWLGTTPASATAPPRIKHCSHIAGVLPEWQGRGIGRQLKLAQRQAVLEQGITAHVTWTYDPLYRTNGAFNLHRLGAVSTTYIRNIYGEMTDALNAGVPTDRCQVDWYLGSPRVCNVVGTCFCASAFREAVVGTCFCASAFREAVVGTCFCASAFREAVVGTCFCASAFRTQHKLQRTP